MRNQFSIKSNDSDFTINVCHSAPNQIQPIQNIQQICQYWLSKGHKKILDVGCGYLRNTHYLLQYFSLCAIDFPQITDSILFKTRYESLKKFNNSCRFFHPDSLEQQNFQANAAFLSFVLHTIPEIEDRIKLIENIKNNLKYPYEIFVAVPKGERYYRHVRSIHYNDGLILKNADGKSTFYKEFSAKQIDDFMSDIGYFPIKVLYVEKKRMRFYQYKE